jgi:predicted nuclease of restriction endonuclease-like (RecB) superfamily
MLYWETGRYVSLKATNEGWGQSVVQELSDYIGSRDSSIKGFSARNIWRMKQLYETYKDSEKLSSLLTQLSWTNHLHILSKTKSFEEKEFYLTLASKNRYPEREFAHLIDSGTFERTMLANKNLSAALTDFPANTENVFKDRYVFEFLGFTNNPQENDLRRALIQNLKKFLLGLGPDFSLIGEEYILQVGMKDFRIDILMNHRGLNCLVAIELKVTEFQLQHLGQMQFYLEVLDKEVKKSHENPSIGILICKTKDEEVVRYALGRSLRL